MTISVLHFLVFMPYLISGIDPYSATLSGLYAELNTWTGPYSGTLSKNIYNMFKLSEKVLEPNI